VLEKSLASAVVHLRIHHLLNFDLTTVNLRTIPKTPALLDQKILSLDADQGWWLDVLIARRVAVGLRTEF